MKEMNKFGILNKNDHTVGWNNYYSKLHLNIHLFKADNIYMLFKDIPKVRLQKHCIP